jgi:hypothetical protein
MEEGVEDFGTRRDILVGRIIKIWRGEGTKGGYFSIQ